MQRNRGGSGNVVHVRHSMMVELMEMMHGVQNLRVFVGAILCKGEGV